MGFTDFNLVLDTPDWPMLLRSAAGVLLLCELAAMVLSLRAGRSWPAAISLSAVGMLTAPGVAIGLVYHSWLTVACSLLGGVALMAIVATFGLMTSVLGQPMRGKSLLRSLFHGTILIALATAGWGWPLSGSVLVIGACATFWMLRSYRRTTAEISTAKKSTLLALRILVVLLVTASLARPALEYERPRAVPSVILLGVDTSASMNRKDAAANPADNTEPQARIAAVSNALKNNAHLLQTLTNQGEVNIFTFAMNCKPQVLLPGKAEGKPPVASLDIWNMPKANGTGTAIGDAAAEAFAPYTAAGRDVSAMILLTDGCNNTADTIEPEKQAELLGQHGVPIFAVGVGSETVTKSVRSLGVKTLRAPDEVEAFNRLPITATVEAMGLEGRQIRVACRFGDVEVGSEIFTVTGRQDTHTSQFEHVPLAAGYHRLTVTATLEGKTVDGLERTPAMSKLVHVMDRELRILYIEGKFRYEAKYLTQAIEAGKRFSIDRRILMQPLSSRQPSPLSEDPKDWLRYHAIIFGDVDASHFTPKQLAIIKELIGEKGKGFCMIGGMNSFGRGGWAGTPIADILPIDVAASNQQLTGAVKIVLTEEGRRSEIMKISGEAADPAEAWAMLGKRSLNGANRLMNPKPGAAVLATDDHQNTMIVCQNYGSGRSLAIAFDTTWQWVLSPEENAEATAELQRRFWRQVSLYLAAPKGNVWIATDKTSYDYRRLAGGQDAVEVSAGVEDAFGLPIPESLKSITLTDPRGRVIPLKLERKGDIFKGKLPTPTEPPNAGNETESGASTYTLKITAEIAGKPLAAEHKFEIVRPNLEARDVLADFALLRKMATVSNGKFVPLAKFPQLLQDIVHDSKPKTIIEIQHVDIAGEFRWPLVIALIALLCLEWAWRKRRGLV